MKKLLLIMSLNFFFIEAKNICVLPKNYVLKIACTKKCPNTYIKALQESAKELGYQIKIITLNSETRNYKQIFSNIDGVLSPGGYDILPKYFTKNLSEQKKEEIEKLYNKYGKTNINAKKRDEFEYNLFSYYFKHKEFNKVPILGVCYGMQMLAAVNNIPLYIDIKKQLNINPRRKVYDKITFIKKSRFYQYFKSFNVENLYGYKNHHQAIDLNYFNKMKKKGYFANITISAVSNKGKIAEIMEFEDFPVMGIQFHAERSKWLTKKMVYNYFLTQACKKKISKKQNITSLFKNLDKGAK